MRIASIKSKQVVDQITAIKRLKNNFIVRIVKNPEGIRGLTTKSIIYRRNQRLCSEQIIDERNSLERVVRTFSIFNLFRDKHIKNTKLTHVFNDSGDRIAVICDDLKAKTRKITAFIKNSDGKLQKISTETEAISKNNL